VGGRQMVDQLLPALQEAIPGVETGADHRDRPQAVIGRVVKDGQRQLLQQIWGRCQSSGRWSSRLWLPGRGGVSRRLLRDDAGGPGRGGRAPTARPGPGWPTEGPGRHPCGGSTPTPW
jgi:hypothetical protein